MCARPLGKSSDIRQYLHELRTINQLQITQPDVLAARPLLRKSAVAEGPDRAGGRGRLCRQEEAQVSETVLKNITVE